MKDLTSVILRCSIMAAAALGTAAVWYFWAGPKHQEVCIALKYLVQKKEQTEETVEPKEEEAQTSAEEDKSNSNGSTEGITLDNMIEIINNVSETMIIVFVGFVFISDEQQHLGNIAIDMVQKGMKEEDINKELSEKFKSTMAVVEKQVIDV